MKKKELKKRIKDLEQLTDCLMSDNVRLLMRLGDIPQCKHEDKYPKQTMTSFPSTEGPESESELKENTISLEVGKKYMTKNHEMVNCEAHVGDGVYQCKIAAGPLFYEANGTLRGNYPEWSITSEAKE